MTSNQQSQKSQETQKCQEPIIFTISYNDDTDTNLIPRGISFDGTYTYQTEIDNKDNLWNVNMVPTWKMSSY